MDMNAGAAMALLVVGFMLALEIMRLQKEIAQLKKENARLNEHVDELADMLVLESPGLGPTEMIDEEVLYQALVNGDASNLPPLSADIQRQSDEVGPDIIEALQKREAKQ